ncbi:BQ5605_C002g01017 [Microbotryum silenes-dioicae]|uniref:BQ5605_C002g01017 protein n=1 Tax=Microbotryum silenes-dioicae TaxID=796604 RepID=A0A2X0MSF9_9BASI|nr:BQ5605_C002g01017 [Microbotryum silenes-dioicae]
MSPFLGLTLPPFGPAARSPEPTGSAPLSPAQATSWSGLLGPSIRALPLLEQCLSRCVIKQLLGLVSLVRRSEPYHRLSSRRNFTGYEPNELPAARSPPIRGSIVRTNQR